MSALLDALGYVGSSLDKPGRAVRGVLAGRPDEGFAALPFSDSLGLTDPDRAVSGQDLLNQFGAGTEGGWLDAGLGFAAEMALDPMTYLGAGAVGRLGRAAGKGLEAAAAARGPGYKYGLTGLTDSIAAHTDPDEAARGMEYLTDMMKSSPAVAGEIPPNARFLGAGQEAMAFATPDDDVLRIALTPTGAPGRPVADSVLQATRTADYPAGGVWEGGNRVYRAERVPMADKVGDASYWLGGSGLPGQTRLGQVREFAAREGLDFTDRIPQNVGLGPAPVVIDPGAVAPTAAFAGGFQPVTAARDPGHLTSALLDLLGGRPAMRRALEAGRGAPGYETALGRTGAFAGAGLGLT